MSVCVLENEKIGAWKIFLAALISVVVSMGMILIFALLIKFFDWSDNVIEVVNIIIKIVSIIIGVLIVARSTTKCLTCGALVGVLYVLISYICFSALLGAFALSIENLWDVLFGMVVGGIVGIIINIIRK